MVAYRGLERHLQEVFFAELVEGEEFVDLHDAGAGAAVGNFRGEVASFEADEAGSRTAGSRTAPQVRGAPVVRRERRGLAEQGAGPGPELFEGGYGPGDG